MNTNSNTQDSIYMQRALEQARLAAEAEEVPVGAVIVLGGEIIAEAHNQPIGLHDPSAHAEIQVLRAAGAKLENYRLPETTLYVTLEPCAMCAGAMIHARVGRVVFAAPDPRTGAAGSVFDLLPSDHRWNHRTECVGGVLADESAELLRTFFRARRKKKKKPCGC